MKDTIRSSNKNIALYLQVKDVLIKTYTRENLETQYVNGAVIDPKALDELLPGWRDDGCSLAATPVTENLPLGTERARASRAFPSSSRRRSCTTRAPIRARSATLPLAGRRAEPSWASRSSPASPRPRSSITTMAAVKGVATGDMGVARDGDAQARLSAGPRAACQIHFLRRGCRAGT